MKKAIVAMLLMAVFLLGGGGLISIVFSSIAGGGVEQSFIYPIYAGIIVLAGLTGLLRAYPAEQTGKAVP